MLELDLVLSRYLDRKLDRLTPEEREAFKALLDLSDIELWDLVSGRATPPAGVQGRLVRDLQSL
jgi:succinate dehydrogenase flavin-adding protein (antitoxin of CptAB toxin-antitoxin module)